MSALTERPSAWTELACPPPSHELRSERPVHALCAAYLASGHDYKTIAKVFNKSEAWVQYVAKQPWVIDKILEIQKEFGKGLLEEARARRAAEAREVVFELLQRASKEETRLKAAQDILDRYEGKPVQKVVQDISFAPPTTEDIDAKLDEVSRLRKELGIA